MSDGHPQLLVDPQRHRLAERAEGAREGRDVGREHALELQQRLVVEADRVEVLGPDARLLQHVLDGAGGEAGVVLLAGEPLLLAGGDDHAVLQEGGRGVVVEAGEAEDVVRHQNWCRDGGLRARAGWARASRQKVGSGARLRSSGSLPEEPHEDADEATETK